MTSSALSDTSMFRRRTFNLILTYAHPGISSYRSFSFCPIPNSLFSAISTNWLKVVIRTSRSSTLFDFVPLILGYCSQRTDRRQRRPQHMANESGCLKRLYRFFVTFGENPKQYHKSCYPFGCKWFRFFVSNSTFRFRTGINSLLYYLNFSLSRLSSSTTFF
jgi:hypothetical protein